ncbi:poly(A)-specific ribonuclease, partial [Coemansia biformis]
GGSDDAYAILAQRLLRFLLEQATSECKDLDDVLATERDPGRRKAVERIFGFRQLTQMTCTTCESVQARESHVASLELDPPQGSAELALVLAGGATSIARADALRSGKKIGFIQLLERALAKSLKAKGWCASCRKFQLMQTDKFITGPPAGYVESDSGTSGARRQFRLAAVVSEIRDQPRGRGHLVVHVRNPDDPCKWLLFNDFLVQPASEDSVTRLYDKWRMPSIAVYADESREDLASIVEAVVDRHPYKFSTSILTSPSSSLDGAFPPLHSPQRNLGAGATGGKAPALASASPKRNEAVALTAAEAGLLDAGEFACALDAEFVVLEEAVTEESSDGTCHFSGIHVGDLTLGISPYKLSTMKEVYRKLRLLVDSGSTIIGHGLARDFRVSNIIVPASQVRDTMLLFQSPSNPRAVSLRFLYWYFYKKAIQT